MLQPDFNPAPTTLRIHRCRYVSRCKARRCPKRATLIAEKVDGAGPHVRQIELCTRYCNVVVKRERARDLRFLIAGTNKKRHALGNTDSRQPGVPSAPEEMGYRNRQSTF